MLNSLKDYLCDAFSSHGWLDRPGYRVAQAEEKARRRSKASLLTRDRDWLDNCALPRNKSHENLNCSPARKPFNSVLFSIITVSLLKFEL